MKQYFSFNPTCYDYWPIYEAISKYYPLGIDHATWPEMRRSYPGSKALAQLINDSIFDQKRFDEWAAFQEQVGKSMQKETNGYTSIHYPAYTSEMVLGIFKYDKVTLYQKIRFSVSLTGPFFTIYGIHETVVMAPNAAGELSAASAINAMIVSPYGDFETAFIQIESMIRERFAGYKLVPLTISTHYVKGLYNTFTSSDESTIHHALFGQLPDPFEEGYMVYGDEYYGYTEWRTDEPLSDGWVAYPPLTDA